MTDVYMKILLSAQDSASSVIRKVAGVLGGSSGLAGVLTGVGLVGGAALLGVAAASVKMAGDFQQSMNMVQSLTGTSSAQMAQYDAQIKQLSDDTGATAKDLANGLFYTISAGGNVATHAMDVLTLSTKDAVIGMTDQQTTAQALTTILKGFSIQAKDFTAANGEMIRTVTLGKMTMGDYAAGISKSISVAVQYHDTMENMNATFATLTANGVKNAKVAGTDYNNLVKVMVGGADSIVKKVQAFMPEFDGVQFKAMSMADKIQWLNYVLKEHGKNFADVAGKQQNAAQAFTILNQHFGEYISNLTALSDKQKNAAATQDAWTITQNGFNVQMSRAKAAIDNVMISIGQQLLPVVTHLLGQLVPLITQFGAWLVKSGALKAASDALTGGIKFVVGAITTMVTIGAGLVNFFKNNETAMDGLKAVLVGLGVIVGTFMVMAFIAWAAAAWAAAAANIAAFWPVYLIAAIVALAVFGIIEAVQHWGAIAHWLQGIWSAVAGFFKEVWKKIVEIFTPIGKWFQDRWKEVVAVFSGVVDFFSGLFEMAWIALTVIFAPIGQWFQDRWNEVTAIFSTVWSAISSFLSGVWNTYVVGPLSALWNNVSTFFGNAWANYVSKPLGALWKSISSAWTSAWDTIKTGVTSLWNSVSGFFGKIWNDYLAKPMQDIWNNISGGFVGLVKKASGWGHDLATAFITAMQQAFTSNPAIGTPFGGDILKWVMGNVNTKLQGHAMGGTIGPGESGYVGDTGGKPEFLYGGMHGITVYNPAQTQAMFGGRGGGHVTHIHSNTINLTVNTPLTSSADFSRLLDNIEYELAKRFRTQTPSYSSGGGSF